MDCGFAGKYGVVDVLTKEEVWNQDILLSVVFSLVDICDYYREHNITLQISHDGCGQWMRTKDIDPLYTPYR